MHFFHPLYVQHSLKMTGKITITVTPLQAQRILHRAQGSGLVHMNFKESGRQSGGFLPMLAALPALGSMAMPLLSGAASALGGLATSQVMKKLTGSGSGVCVTCTKTQMNKLKQSGRGITVNFRISKSKKNPQAMMGAGIADHLPEMLLQPLKQMAQVAASKVAQKAGEVMASKTVQKLFGHADEAQKKVKKVKKKAQGGAGIRLAGKGVRLAGGGRGRGINLAGRRITQHGTGIVDDIQDVARSVKKKLEDASSDARRFVVRTID